MTHEAPETRPRAAEHAPATLDCHLGHGVRLRVTTHSDGSVHLSLLRRDGRPASLSTPPAWDCRGPGWRPWSYGPARRREPPRGSQAGLASKACRSWMDARDRA